MHSQARAQEDSTSGVYVESKRGTEQLKIFYSLTACEGELAFPLTPPSFFCRYNLWGDESGGELILINCLLHKRHLYLLSNPQIK